MSYPLKADDAVLVLIDHQVLSMSLMRTVPPDVVLANSVALVKAAKILDIPGVWTSSTEIENKDWWHPELAELDGTAHDARIMRTGIIDSWDQPEFVSAIEATGRRTLVIAGTSTEGCVLVTALSARRAGYDVQVVVDASGSAFRMAEEAALHRLTQAGVAVTSTSTLIGELAHNWQSPTGAELRHVLAENFEKTLGNFSLSK